MNEDAKFFIERISGGMSPAAISTLNSIEIKVARHKNHLLRKLRKEGKDQDAEYLLKYIKEEHNKLKPQTKPILDKHYKDKEEIWTRYSTQLEKDILEISNELEPIKSNIQLLKEKASKLESKLKDTQKQSFKSLSEEIERKEQEFEKIYLSAYLGLEKKILKKVEEMEHK